MGRYIGILFVATGLAGILLITGMRKRMEWLLDFLMRSVLGAIAIYFCNAALAGVGISNCVGLNWLTVLTAGILGFPGVAALYGIGFYQML